MKPALYHIRFRARLVSDQGGYGKVSEDKTLPSTGRH
jgi:hypothetical protein